MLYTAIFSYAKIVNFIGKKIDIFYILLKILIVGTRSNENPHCFGSKMRKLGKPNKTQFYYVKVGFRGYTFHGHVFLSLM